MALADKKYTELYASSKKTDIESVHAEGLLSHMIDNPSDDPFLISVLKEIKDLQEELDALRVEIAANKAKTPIATGANTVVSFGDMVFTTVKGKTTHSIVMTVAYTDPSSSKVTTKTTTLTLA